MPVFYTQKEAAEYLRCSEKTILSARGSEERCRSSSSAITLKSRKEHLDALLKEPPPSPVPPQRSWMHTRHSDLDELPAALMRPVRKSAFAE